MPSQEGSDKQHGLTDEDVKVIAAKKKEYMDAATNGSAELPDIAREYFDTAIDALLKDHLGKAEIIPGPLPGCGPNPDPDNTHVKEGGWGGDTASPELWKSTAMKDDPNLWKVVDSQDKNIADKFDSQQDADKYISYHQCKKEQGLPIPEPGEPPVIVKPEEPLPPSAGEGTEGPYPVKGNKYSHTIRRAVRHYASGAADDETVEANIKSIKEGNHQFVVDVQVPKTMEHDDNLSMKHGGRHMNEGWFDQSVSIYGGRTGLGVEKKHPSTKLFVIKGPEIGDVRGKRIQIGAVYFKDENKCELYTNLGDGWKKQVEGTDIAGFNPKASTFECQLRIDGFKKNDEPKIQAAWASAV